MDERIHGRKAMHRNQTARATPERTRTSGALFLSLLLCCNALALSPARGATYEVKQDGTGDFSVIQEAMDAAVDGDMVIVHPGSYRENIHFDGKNITLQSLDPEDEEIVASTILDGSRKGSVVTFAGTEDRTCLLSGLTITNGSSHDGGGILGWDPSAYPPVCTQAGISNCTITGNSAGACGGGVDCCNGTITQCMITGNTAYTGGGLWCCDGPISKCVIAGNSASGWLGGGGGLYGGEGSITDCTIAGNSTDSLGGGLFYYDGIISNCTISSNSADWGGGLSFCRAQIDNCAISGNAADGEGGGLSDCAGRIRNCTISNNSAGSKGGGLGSCSGTIINCIVWGNHAPEGRELSERDYVVTTFSCVRGWTGGGEGNISKDPLFVTGPLGDYYLSCRAAGQAADSPCIDAGIATGESVGLGKRTTRTDGVPDAGIVDMGYHYPVPDSKPRIGCSLNLADFQPGELLVAFVEGENEGPDVAVDVYLGFVLPDGSTLCHTGNDFEWDWVPWLASITLPQGFRCGSTEAFRLVIPENASTGDYLLGFALVRTNGPEGLTAASMFPFVISAK
ncbi:MAG: hypothetical protein JW759_06215 [Candidatus Coatesbacteria bacterium]|nr:hypothetical protein [Candidatus Coatesbacteria bacterium]